MNNMGALTHVNPNNAPYQGQYTHPIDPKMAYQQPQTAPFDPVYLQDIYGKLESLKRAFEGAHSVQKEALETAATDKTRITKLEGEVARLKAELEDLKLRQVPDSGSLPTIALKNPLSKEGETEVSKVRKALNGPPKITGYKLSGLLKNLGEEISQAEITNPGSLPAITLGRALSEEGEIEDDKPAKEDSRRRTRQSTRANKVEVGNARKRIKRERSD